MTGGFLVVRLGALGDLIHTLPAVAALRRAHPHARIDWLVEPRHRELLDLVPILTSVIVLERRSLGGWLDITRRLQQRRYDVALDFQGLMKSAALARWSGARDVVGFDRASLREPAARWFYRTVAAVGEGRHVIHKNLALVNEVLGRRDTTLEFPLQDVDSAALADVRARGIARLALVNPGAAWPNKRWPAERFGAVAGHLAKAHGLTPLVLWGPNERELAERVVSASGGHAAVAPETRLADLVALSRAASIIVSGDTGPLHVACAVGTPSVSVFGPTDAARNGPWDPRDYVLTRYGACACHYKRQCAQPSAWCLGTIDVASVIEQIDTRLAPR